MSIENAMVERQVMDGLKLGNEILGKIQAEMRVEDVEKLMEDTRDAIAYQKVPYLCWGHSS